jgi:histidinol phosphatase-like enzyme
MKIFVFDLDGTICSEKPTFEKSLAEPIYGIITKINKLFDEGNHIIIYSARGWQEYNMTKYWLDSNSVKYHQLICGKPIYDYWIDDRSIHPKDFK